MGKGEKTEGDICCPIKMKTGKIKHLNFTRFILGILIKDFTFSVSETN